MPGSPEKPASVQLFAQYALADYGRCIVNRFCSMEIVRLEILHSVYICTCIANKEKPVIYQPCRDSGTQLYNPERRQEACVRRGAGAA
jgi:hypothetical protein